MCSQHAEDKPAADALIENKFVPIKKPLMITFETLREPMRDHLPGMSIYHMVLLEANIDSHYFKRLQTLQVFCNNLYCLIRTLSKLAYSAH